MNSTSILFPEPSPNPNYTVHGSLNAPLGKVITVQDAINLLLQAPDKAAPLTIDSNRFYSKLSITHTDNCIRLDATVAPYINAVTYDYPKQTTPRQYYRTDAGGSFSDVQLESVLKGCSQ